MFRPVVPEFNPFAAAPCRPCNKAVTPARVAAMANSIREPAETPVGRFAARGRTDLRAAFAHPCHAIALEALTARLPNLRRQEGQSARYVPNLVSRGPAALPLARDVA